MSARTPALPDDFHVVCSECGASLLAREHFCAGQLKKKRPRCRACAPNKFGNRKDQGAASRKESRKAQHYRTLAAAGLIANLREQVRFELIPTQYDEAGKLLERPMAYIADFVFDDADGNHVIDAKGMRTDVYRIKRKLMRWVHGIGIEEV